MRATQNTLPVAALALAALLALPTATHAADPVRERTITVSASATIAAQPDMAHVQFAVTTEAQSAREALTQNNQRMAQLIDGMKRLGVVATDLRTAGLAVFPRYGSRTASSVPRIEGYQATNSLRVTVRDLEKLGGLLDQSITLGANQVQGIQFEVSKAETLRDDARRGAMVNALRRAELFASAAGAKVGPVLQISETISGLQPRRFQAQAASRASADSVPVEPGTQNLEAQVHVVYALE